VELETRGEIPLKGKTDPVPVYAPVLARLPQATTEQAVGR
jgi:hypothetical protein